VSISSDAKYRLINGHNVRGKGHWWIFRTASSSKVAREIEDYFVNTLGTDGGPGGGDEAANQVMLTKKLHILIHNYVVTIFRRFEAGGGRISPGFSIQISPSRINGS